MKNRSWLCRLVALTFLLLLGPILFLWWYGRIFVSYPIERFMPRECAVVVRVAHAREAWQRHWTGRKGPAAEAALQGLMEAMGAWPRWVKKYGETQARVRLSLYQQTIFHALGDEAWLVFGKWVSAEPPQGENVGLVAFLRADSSVKSQVGPLVNLFMEDYQIERSEVQGVTLYAYKDRHVDRSLTFCKVGGWICASLTQRGPGPLPAIIEQVHAANAVVPAAEKNGLTNKHGATGPWGSLMPATSALSGVAWPAIFFEEFRQFTVQRGGELSKDSRKALKRWVRRFDGVEQLVLTQAGDSLFDLQLVAQGRGVAAINRTLVAEAATTASLATTGVKGDAPPGALENAPAAGSELAQLDMSVPFARVLLPRLGYAPGDLQKEAGFLTLADPGAWALLSDQLGGAPGSLGGADRGRIGLGAFAAPESLLPGVLFWADPAGGRDLAGAPARRWAMVASRTAPDSARARAVWLLPPIGQPAAVGEAPGELARWSSLVDETWQRGPAAPQAFGAINFGAVAGALRDVPTILMKKKKRKEIASWQKTMQAVALGVGGVALRIDAEADCWRLTSRTP